MSYLSILDKKYRQSAAFLEKDHCIRCGFCCFRRPCISTPEELVKIADFLKMSVNEMVHKYFVIDSFSEYDVKFLIPAKKCQQDLLAKYLPTTRTWDRDYCIFFDEKEKSCKIYDVRPKQARDTNCWIKNIPEDITSGPIFSWCSVDFKVYDIHLTEG